MTRAAPNPVDASRRVVLDALGAWVERGWLRRLDAALARFVADLDPSADATVLLATALVAHLEGQGHTCLVIDDFVADGGAVLRWNDDARDALRGLLGRLPPDAAAWLVACRRSAVVDPTGRGASDGTPLVLYDGRLYLRRYWQHERRVADAVRTRVGEPIAVDVALARTRLARLFPASPDHEATVDWQKVACAIALRGRLSIVTGGPGTGKTFTAARVIALLHAMTPVAATLRIALAAPTGKAAARLRHAIDEALVALPDDGPSLREVAARIGPATTLHALLGTRPGTRRFRHDAATPLDVDVVIVDEASMVHVEMMDALLAALPARARVLLLGDKDQLASVEAGAVLGELCGDAAHPRYDAATAAYVEAVVGDRLAAADLDAAGPALAQQIVLLRRSQRFSGAIGALAQAVNDGDADAAVGLLASPDDATLDWIAPAVPDAVVDLAAAGYRRYLDALRDRPRSNADAADEADADADADDADADADDADATEAAWARGVLDAFDAFRILCAVRDGTWGVEALNDAVAARLAADDPTVRGTGEWYEGRPVIVTRNDYGLGLFNGDIGIALRVAADAAPLRVCFPDGAGVKSIGVARLGPVETAFAMTVHKAQGSEFDHTVLVLPAEASPVATRELVYTGITRARRAFTLVSAHRDALRDAIERTTRRSSGLVGLVRDGSPR